MHIRKAISLLALVLPVILVGCDNDDNPSTENTSTMPAPGDNQVEVLTMDGLAGTWNQACSASASSAEYSSAQMTIADNVATATESFFTDNACTLAASPAVVVTESSLVFDGTTISTSLGNASTVESTVESRLIDGVVDTTGTNVITYDIMLIINNTLYFGDTSDINNGTSAELRPQTLDQTMTWSNL